MAQQRGSRITQDEVENQLYDLVLVNTRTHVEGCGWVGLLDAMHHILTERMYPDLPEAQILGHRLDALKFFAERLDGDRFPLDPPSRRTLTNR